MDPYIQMLITFIGSIFLALITSKISHRFFYKEELWLRKEKRYNEIINNLSILLKHYSDTIDEVEIGEKYNFMEAKNEVNKAQRELERLSISPTFILDNKVQAVLKALFHAASQRIGDEAYNDFYSYYVRVYGETKKSVEEIARLARKELNIRN